MSYTTQAKLKPHKKNVWCMATLTRLFKNVLREKKKKKGRLKYYTEYTGQKAAGFQTAYKGLGEANGYNT